MKEIFVLISLFCYYVRSTACQESTVDVFKFGVDIGRVTFNKSGKIGPFEKNISVPINLSPCTELTYVRVEVDNKVGPPHVSFDDNLNIVHIKYRRLQHSRSSYVVTAKTVPGECQ